MLAMHRGRVVPHYFSPSRAVMMALTERPQAASGRAVSGAPG
jgi:hypothetical protein